MDEIENAITQMQQRMNNALADLPPIEQVGLAQEMVYCIRACRRANEEMKGIFQILRDAVTGVETMAQKKRDTIVAEVKAQLATDAEFLKANKLITAADHDTAVTAAVNAQKETLKTEVEKGIATVRQVAERRKQLVTDKVLTSVAAEAAPEELLTGDDFKDKVAKIVPRLEKLGKLKGLAEDADTVKRVLSFPINAEGEQGFSESFAIWEKAAKAGGAGGPGAPLNPPPGDVTKAVVLF